ncbi:hypothetical protein JCGZ_04956 [Jatropha curcas]|uniref:Uncharacterized protein n=1 Tax=Jatropha curcas TaxID=180498 RepID=A0A067JCS6_JATCU|nr:hypothetical protein JCGZ_04956 [Jatropha curcas]
MTSSSHSSDEGFLESLGISLEEVNVTADADTHASVTGIYAQAEIPVYRAGFWLISISSG